MLTCWHNKGANINHICRVTAVGGLGCYNEAIAEFVATQQKNCANLGARTNAIWHCSLLGQKSFQQVVLYRQSCNV